ncbi:cyclophilin family peptidyl-prolyl cis-trans isomerase [Tenacibaculum adriaticum]|uniref:peptidylprolyl isomerase n=1 Tax=Tenacibaculum adriaticum TaxID=413713 RepID=A0A5S5DJF4_9FLAO|nr:peptidylprolyl isomerase [Tenacibaculum adriaticum]TYP96080.1 cyclophilin family peptidyl-prolyl cis-trans isomerase [Tenacibaculum adriaticum]
MKTHKFLLLFLIITTLYHCKEEKRLPQKKTINPPKNIVAKEEKQIIKAWDSLNRQNTNVFLTEYGKQNKETIVLIKTELGNIKLRLFNDTPLHRASFIFLTKIGYFNTTVFYRIAKNMAIQGGDSDSKTTANMRNKYKNYLLKPEIKKNRKHKYGALAAAKQFEDNPDKLSSPFDFYIVQNKYGAHHLDGDYTVFGEVLSGFSTIHKIAKVETTPDEWPLDDILMTIEVLE